MDSTTNGAAEYDVFISHASEDKDDFVRGLAHALEARRIRCWYDEFTVQPGDSLRRSIDRGLLLSQAGILVLSESFFAKRWPAYELDGLVERFTSVGGQDSEEGSGSRLIPIWHNVDADAVRGFSPSLANLVSLQSGYGIEQVADRVMNALRPGGSALLFAYREFARLTEPYGWAPHIITDDWWLDVVETASSNDVEGTFQEPMGWGHWGFPLPAASREPQERGHRLAWAAAQMVWQRTGTRINISQLTPPTEVLEFIASCPGLAEACVKEPAYMLSYAPQLALPGQAGFLQDLVDETFQWATSRLRGLGIDPNTRAGRVRLVRDHSYLALRDVRLLEASPSHAACGWVQGEIHGPPVSVHDPIDHAAWLVSEASAWLGKARRQVLIHGIVKWSVWPQWRNSESWRNQEKLLELLEVDRLSDSQLSIVTEIVSERVSLTVAELNLPETADTLVAKLLKAGLVKKYRKNRH